MRDLSSTRIASFRRKIWRFYKANRRMFPFRKTTDPYRITVSEIMLQQTQAARVVEKYNAWINRWPDWRSLATASNRELLSAWSGLGYNRRALLIGKLARTVVKDHGGILPDVESALVNLPGIGSYTARAILIFAHNRPLITIDTNIRRVILHELNLPRSLSAPQLETVARRLLPKGRSREWHYALMDYSRLALPRRLEQIPPLTKQSRFKGSLRQIRGEIIRQLTVKKSIRTGAVAKVLGRAETDVFVAAEALAKEGIILIKENLLRLA